MDLEKSHGSWLVDGRDGSEYLDMFSMFASGAVGYNHPTIVAQRERLAISSQNKPTLSDVYNVYYAEFLETFSRTAIPAYLPHVFFIEGGSLAVENTLKVAFDWKVRKNMSNGKGEKGSKIIHFNQAFHGRSGYTLSLTNTTDPRKTMYFPKFDWPRIDNPCIEYDLDGNVSNDIAASELQSKKDLDAAFSKHGDKVAGIIVEPMQELGTKVGIATFTLHWFYNYSCNLVAML
jgi:L-lysine 6-transaminase